MINGWSKPSSILLTKYLKLFSNWFHSKFRNIHVRWSTQSKDHCLCDVAGLKMRIVVEKIDISINVGTNKPWADALKYFLISIFVFLFLNFCNLPLLCIGAYHG